MIVKYVTGNWAKIMSARQVLEPLGVTVEQIKMDVPEIQADKTEEIAKFSAKWASDELKCNVIKNDTGLCIEALNGFPGPYTHYVEDKIGVDGILKLLKGVEQRNAYFIEVIAYCEYKKEPVCFKSITKGRIALKKSGSYGWGWDYIFIPDSSNKTLAHFDNDIRFQYWDTKGYIELANYLKKQMSLKTFF